MNRIQWLIVSWATLGMLAAPVSAVELGPAAKEKGTTPPPLADVSLDQAGVLRARVLDAALRPLVGRRVEIVKNQQVIANAETDQHGYLAIPGLTGGIYQLRTVKAVRVFRVWTAEAAPPAAVSQVEVAETETIVRGQDACQCGECADCCSVGGVPTGFSANEPIMIAALLAAAIAVPIAVHNSGGDTPPGS